MRGTLLLCAALLITGLAGCTESETTPTSSTDGASLGPSVEIEEGVVVASSHGAVRGTVHSDTGLVLEGAGVALIGSQHVGTTNKTGQFLFLNVSIGEHRLRIEATGFRAFEGDLKVKASELTEIHPTLVALEPGNPDYQAHLHDYWGADTAINLVDRTYQMKEFRGPSLVSQASPAANEASNAVLSANVVSSSMRYRILLPENPQRPPLVYAGTERIEVNLKWNNAPPGVPTYAFAYSPANSYNVTVLEAHGPGIPWVIQVDSDSTDNGHQPFSFWNFYIVPVNNAPAAPNYRPALAVEPIQVKITVFKGSATPPEPSHPEFWTNGSTLVIRDANATPRSVAPNVWGVNEFELPKPNIVPPGTKWMALELRWSYTDAIPSNAALNPNYVIYYNPGNQHWDRYTDTWKMVKPTSSSTAGVLKFNITLEPGEADGFYQKLSMWRWLVRPSETPAGKDFLPSDFYRSRQYQLIITAIKDPAIGVR